MSIQLNLDPADVDNLLVAIGIARKSPQTNDEGVDVLTFLRQKILVQCNNQQATQAVQHPAMEVIVESESEGAMESTAPEGPPMTRAERRNGYKSGKAGR
jgi:hypothetical protein